MDFDQEIRAALIAYRKAHLAWKREPVGIFVNPSREWEGTTRNAAKKRWEAAHGKLLQLAELLEHKPP